MLQQPVSPDETVKLLLVFLSGPVFGGMIAAVWIYWTRVREPARMKERQNSTIYTQEQQRSLAVATQMGESRTQEQLLESYGEMVTHLISSNNGHMTELTKAVIEGNKDIINAILEGNKDLIAAILDGNMKSALSFSQVASSQNQVITYLMERTGQPLSGGNPSTLDAALMRSAAVTRTDAFMAAVDADIHAGKEASKESSKDKEDKDVDVAAGESATVIIEGAAPLTVTKHEGKPDG